MKKKKLTSLDILDGTVGRSAALSRTEMKQIMAGSGCMSVCQNIAYACFSASAAAQGSYDSICRRQFTCCAAGCMNYGC